MKKTIALLTVVFGIILCLSACGIADNSEQTQQSQTGITSLRFATLSSPVNLEASKNKTGYFKVECNGEFSIDDIEFVSTNKSVASFEYDETALNTCIYYTITGLSEGETTIYAQTRDGLVKTDKIVVKVTGYSYSIEKVDDISIKNAKRHTIRATVDESLVEGRTEEQIKSLMEYIVLSYSDVHKLNAIHLLLYIKGDDTADGATVGICTYAPYGELGRASEISAGDYSSFEFCDFTIYPTETRNALRGN